MLRPEYGCRHSGLKCVRGEASSKLVPFGSRSKGRGQIDGLGALLLCTAAVYRGSAWNVTVGFQPGITLPSFPVWNVFLVRQVPKGFPLESRREGGGGWRESEAGGVNQIRPICLHSSPTAYP